MGEYSKYNAEAVLRRVNDYIDDLEAAKNRHEIRKYEGKGFAMHWRGYASRIVYDLRLMCEDLAIFDWWDDDLSLSQLKQMKQFLEQAIKLGFTGKVSFKVGVRGCANGMWAHTAESTDGYDPSDCDVLYHSFVSGENYWTAKINDEWMSDDPESFRHTLKEVKAFMNR